MTKEETDRLLANLSGGGYLSSKKCVSRFLDLWSSGFGAWVESRGISENAFCFVSDFGEIHFHGMNDVPCLAVGGDDLSDTTAAQFKRMAMIPGKIPFVIVLSEKVRGKIESLFPKSRCLILSSEQLASAMQSDAPANALKLILLSEFSIRRLIPYTVSLPVTGNMFFGRGEELNLLEERETDSFAVVGPSRIGKSSLLKQFTNQRKKTQKSDVFNTFEIDFYELSNPSSDETARFLAMKIEPSRRSSKMTASDIINFLKYQKTKYGLPVELILDEVDEVCETETFKQLGEAVKLGVCRLVLCGRSAILKKAINAEDPLQCRLRFLTLKPLSDNEARELIFEPIEDLGFTLEDKDRFIERTIRLTGGMPHLLQLFGEKLISRALEEGKNTIDSEMLETQAFDFETAQYVMSPLLSLADEEVRKIAWEILKRDLPVVDMRTIRTIAAESGISSDYARVTDICNDMVVNNVLFWYKGCFLRNEALNTYAKNLGYSLAGIHNDG